MKMFFRLLLAFSAAVLLFSCQKMPDYGSPEGKYWMSYTNNLIYDVIDLGATRRGFAYDIRDANAMAAYAGEEIIVGDNCNRYTIRKDKLNQYTVELDIPIKFVFQMLAEDVARVDFFENGEKYGSAVATRIQANVRYEEPVL